MKKLIIINGTMGVGKTSTCRELQKIIPQNVFLDGDWCWDMNPFIVNDETKNMVINNIVYMLNSFLECSEIKNIIFCWVMHEQNIINTIVSRLHECNIYIYSLTASEEALEKRLMYDINSGVRKNDIISRSKERLKMYDKLDTEKIDASNISAKDAAVIIFDKLNKNDKMGIDL